MKINYTQNGALCESCRRRAGKETNDGQIFSPRPRRKEERNEKGPSAPLRYSIYTFMLVFTSPRCKHRYIYFFVCWRRCHPAKWRLFFPSFSSAGCVAHCRATPFLLPPPPFAAVTAAAVIERTHIEWPESQSKTPYDVQWCSVTVVHSTTCSPSNPIYYWNCKQVFSSSAIQLHI